MKSLKKKDWVFIGIIVVLAIVGLLAMQYINSNEADLTVVITIDGKVFREIPLTQETNEEIIVEENGNSNVVIIKDGQVFVREASCPDQICVQTSPADENGEMVVCLPNKVIVEVVAND